jgi:hypothetical protein
MLLSNKITVWDILFLKYFTVMAYFHDGQNLHILVIHINNKVFCAKYFKSVDFYVKLNNIIMIATMHMSETIIISKCSRQLKK